MKNKILKSTVTTVVAAMLVTTLASPVGVLAHNIGDPVNLYRMYNPNSGEHFYTADDNERLSLISSGWDYEGAGWVSPDMSDQPVYRLYNPNAGEHFYTMSATEKDSLVAAGWKAEGIGWYSDPNKSVAVMREYNKNATVGSHNYSTSADEDSNLVKAGWSSEGVVFYGMPASSAPQAPAPVIHQKVATSTNATTVYNGVDYKDVYNYDYYTQNNPDVVQAVGTDQNAVIAHFVNSGMNEFRQGSSEFNPTYYALNNGDLCRKYDHNKPAYYLDYINTGKAEGRNATTLNNPDDLNGMAFENMSDPIIYSIIHH